MRQLLDNYPMTIQYRRGFGAWTYHLIIPNTRPIVGKWGDLKVIGSIDGHIIKNLNLAPRKNSDKLISINQEIRSSIDKTAGDTVIVTLYLIDWFDEKEEIDELIKSLERLGDSASSDSPSTK